MIDRKEAIKQLLAQGQLPTEENITRLMGVEVKQEEYVEEPTQDDKVTILNTKGDIDLKVKVLREVLYNPGKLNVKDLIGMLKLLMI